MQEEAKKLISQAMTEGKSVVINDYVNSSGQVSTVKAFPMPSWGYRAIVRGCLLASQVSDPKWTNVPEEAPFSNEDLKVATDELVTSWLKHLSGETSGNTGSPAPAEGLVLWGALVEEATVSSGYDKVVKSASKTLAKKYLTSLTPLSAYVHRYNLYDVKFSHVEVKPLTVGSMAHRLFGGLKTTMDTFRGMSDKDVEDAMNGEQDLFLRAVQLEAWKHEKAKPC